MNFLRVFQEYFIDTYKIIAYIYYFNYIHITIIIIIPIYVFKSPILKWELTYIMQPLKCGFYNKGTKESIYEKQ